MERRDIILTIVFSILGALLVIGSIVFVIYWCRKRKRKRDEEHLDEEDLKQDGGPSGDKKNGFLSLKTPLISTKTLGWVSFLRQSFQGLNVLMSRDKQNRETKLEHTFVKTTKREVSGKLKGIRLVR